MLGVCAFTSLWLHIAFLSWFSFDFILLINFYFILQSFYVSFESLQIIGRKLRYKLTKIDLQEKMISKYQINFNRENKNMTYRSQIPTNTLLSKFQP